MSTRSYGTTHAGNGLTIGLMAVVGALAFAALFLGFLAVIEISQMGGPHNMIGEPHVAEKTTKVFERLESNSTPRSDKRPENPFGATT
jgi:hypothetical protein